MNQRAYEESEVKPETATLTDAVKLLRTIKNLLVFFAVLAVLGMVFGFLVTVFH